MFINSTAPNNFCCPLTRRPPCEKCASLKVSCLLQPYRLFWQALDYSDRHRMTNPVIASILLATRGIIFLGTPHRGNGAESLSQLVAAIVQSVQGVKEILLSDLERESQTLDRITDSFFQILNRRSISVFSFVEELGTSDGKKVNIACVGW